MFSHYRQVIGGEALRRCHEIVKITLILIIASAITQARGESFIIPPEDVDLIGSLSILDVEQGVFPVDIA